MSNDIFISYRRKDLEFVTQLHQALIKRGFSAWFDQENIEVADHWRSSIAQGIRECKIFVLALSPDAVESVNIRKEVDLAEQHGKKIVPLMWRPTEIPVAFEYALAGIQWIDFKQVASEQNFDDLAAVLKQLLAGSDMTQATQNVQSATATPPIPTVEKEAAPAQAGGGRKLGGLKKKQTTSPIALGGQIISGVVITFELGVEDQNFVSTELKWLFKAVDYFIKLRQGETPSALPEIPAEAERIPPTTKGQLLAGLDPFDLRMWDGQIDSAMTRIGTHLKNLAILLDREAFLGEAGKGDVALQNQIKGERMSIVKVLRELAALMKEAFGIGITSPDQLAEFLA